MEPSRGTSGRNPAHSANRFRVALPLATLLVSAALVTGCGDGDEPAGANESSPATTESPGDEPVGELPSEGGGTEAPDSAAKNDGGARDESGPKGKKKGDSEKKDGSGGGADKGAPDPSELDSKENDVPPEAGSPAEAFEKFCDENPAACD